MPKQEPCRLCRILIPGLNRCSQANGSNCPQQALQKMMSKAFKRHAGLEITDNPFSSQKFFSLFHHFLQEQRQIFFAHGRHMGKKVGIGQGAQP